MKSHHYNPKVYLKGFRYPASKNLIWEYSLTDGTVRKSTPKDSGCEDFYHSIVGPDGTKDHEIIEKSFAPLENSLDSLFEAIRQQNPLSEHLKRILISLMALQELRSPKSLDRFNNFQSEVLESAFEIYKHTQSFEKIVVAGGLCPDMVRKLNFQVKAPKDESLLLLLATWPDLEHMLSQLNWTVFIAPPNKHFFTSDNPVSKWAPREKRGRFNSVGLANQDVEVVFPISRRACAFGCWRDAPESELYRDIPPEGVDYFNNRTIWNGWRYAYGPEDLPSIRETVKGLMQWKAQQKAK